MDPPLSLHTSKPPTPEASATCAPGWGCRHQGTSSLGFVLAAAALVALAVVCCALLLLMRRLARGSAVEGSASQASPQEEPDSESEEKIEGILSKDVVLQMSGATLVLFPGEEQPRILAVPSQLHLPPQQPTLDTHIVCVSQVCSP